LKQGEVINLPEPADGRLLAVARDALSRHFFLALICFPLACGAPALAQTGMPVPRYPRTPVGLMMDNALGRPRHCDHDRRRPIILYSPALERAVAPPTGLFVYAHECGIRRWPSSPQLTPDREQDRIAGPSI